jgi:hypothetical protein
MILSPPPQQIIPTGKEIVAGVLFFAKTLNDSPIQQSNSETALHNMHTP